MKKLFFISFLAMGIAGIVKAQVTEEEGNLRAQSSDTVTGWKTGGVFGFNFSQASFTNWASGGQNSISLNALASVFANYKKGKSTWDNTLDVGYGLLQQGKNASVIKTDDKIDFSSKFGQAASKSWYYAALLNLKTQLTPGYNYPNDSFKISDFLAPAYLLGAIGMDYKPNDNFTAFIAPLTSKNTLVNNRLLANAGAFGVEKAVYDNAGNLVTPGANVRSEFGGYLKMVYKRTLMKEKNISFVSKLDLFSNYLHNPQNIDVSWENIIGLKVTKYISATISTHMLYDDDIDIAVDNNSDGLVDVVGPRTQFKEVIGVGISYKF